jgi:hypothetical protein
MSEGKPIPIEWGANRISGDLLWYCDFATGKTSGPMSEGMQRVAVVGQAASWIGTRYHPMQAVKAKRDEADQIIDRGGVDCATLLNEVYADAGMIERLPHLMQVEREVRGLIDGN